MKTTSMEQQIKFLVVGQIFSQIAIQMVWFAIGIWIWSKSHSTTDMLLLGAISTTIRTVSSLFVGSFVDKNKNRTLFLISDFILFGITLCCLFLYKVESLDLVYTVPLAALSGLAEAILLPNISSLIARNISKEKYIKFNGLASLIDSTAVLISPLLAGALLGLFNISLVFILSSTLIVMALAVTYGFKEQNTVASFKLSSNLLKEAIKGLHLISSHRHLRFDLIRATLINFFATIGISLINPFILSQTTGSEAVLSRVRFFMGLGGVVGGLVISHLAPQKNKLYFSSLYTILLFGIGMIPLSTTKNHYIWYISSFALIFFIPFVGAISSSLWQQKVPKNYQGRIFSFRRLIIQSSIPLAMFVAGPVTDELEKIFSRNYLILSAHGMLIASSAVCGILVSLIFISLKAYRQFEHIEEIKIYEDSTLRL